MIRSMTAYARREIKEALGSAGRRSAGSTSSLPKDFRLPEQDAVALNLSFASVFVLA